MIIKARNKLQPHFSWYTSITYSTFWFDFCERLKNRAMTNKAETDNNYWYSESRELWFFFRHWRLRKWCRKHPVSPVTLKLASRKFGISELIYTISCPCWCLSLSTSIWDHLANIHSSFWRNNTRRLALGHISLECWHRHTQVAESKCIYRYIRSQTRNDKITNQVVIYW